MKKILGAPKSIRELFTGVKYSIHYYQREYQWQRKQIEELVEDLTGEFLEYYAETHERNEVEKYITEEAFNKSSAKWIPPKSLVIALAGQGKTKGMVAQVQFETTCNQSLGVIVPNDKIYNRFLQYWLKNNYLNIRSLGGGDKGDGLNLVMIGGIPIPIPLFNEQVLIANFLDNKNFEFDTFIQKSQQEIELLKEYKTALISEVVTGNAAHAKCPAQNANDYPA